MKERIASFTFRAIMYGSMWLFGLFPIQIGIAALYGVEYIYLSADQIRSLSSTYWGVILIPPILKFLGRVLAAILGDIWIVIQNEFSLLIYRASHGEVKQTFIARLWGILSLVGSIALSCWSLWWIATSFLTYESAQTVSILLWASIVVAFMKAVQKTDVEKD